MYFCFEDAVPILEAQFKRNAFPSRAEKEHLASQTHMDYRQIHVWVRLHLACIIPGYSRCAI